MTGMDATPDPSTFSPVPPPHAPHTGLDSFFDSIRRIGIVRTESRWIRGVSGGLARRLGIDVALTRGILLVLAIFGGLGLVVYGAAWALLPEERDGRIHLQEAIRGNVDGAIVGAIALVVLGAARPDSVWPTSFFPWGRLGSAVSALFGALVVAAIVVLIVRSIGSGKRSGASAGPVALPRTGYPVAPAAGIVNEGMTMDRRTAPQPGVAGNETDASAPGANGAPADGGTSAAAAPRGDGATQQVPAQGGYPPWAGAYPPGVRCRTTRARPPMATSRRPATANRSRRARTHRPRRPCPPRRARSTCEDPGRRRSASSSRSGSSPPPGCSYWIAPGSSRRPRGRSPRARSSCSSASGSSRPATAGVPAESSASWRS